MSTRNVVVAAMMLLSGSMYAQQTPKLLRAHNGTYSITFEYDNAGRLVKDVATDTDGGGETETRTSTYTYTPDKVIQQYTEGNLPNANRLVGIVEDGKIVKETFVTDAEPQEQIQEVQTRTFTYNTANQLVKIVESSSQAQDENTYVITWTDGCPSNIKAYHEGECVGEMDYTYDKSITNPYVVSMLNPIQHFLGYEAIIPYGQFFGGYYGVPVKYALNGVKYNVYVEKYYGWDERDNFTITYNKDAKGQVVSGTHTDEETTTIRFEWENIATGIKAPATHTADTATYYQSNGMRIPAPRKGLNIIRSTDGAVRKVIRTR